MSTYFTDMALQTEPINPRSKVITHYLYIRIQDGHPCCHGTVKPNSIFNLTEIKKCFLTKWVSLLPFTLYSVTERDLACWCAAGSFTVALKPLDALERRSACVTWHQPACPPGCKNRHQHWSPGTNVFNRVCQKSLNQLPTHWLSLSPTLLPVYHDCRAREKLSKFEMACL